MNLKVTESEFKKLLKKYNPQEIINMYCGWKINLKSEQLDRLIEIRDRKEQRENGEDKKSKTKRD